MYKIKLKLKEKRLDAKITQKTLARKCNINQGHISKCERNLKSPTLTTVEKFCNALKIHPNELLDIYKD
ncbi:helix-turn-helix transcriptional regulator [Clostridium botulinum C/D]|uniref:helix-turn-helix domain-containing protein n=1 Tax=Clostridium botulinum TaxID=1491 RepID=UPI0004D54CCD|nr:helix-turn-helix transcriptional regulator [Clostridium botulinum]KEH96133.1 DNA binding protein [Clostridium botulinum D str. 16868]MCD3211084.1 helix-turn-helix transcriptional regulator [Clostridium botulinum C/D]